MVRSILLVASEGKVYRIEPENGITDPTTCQTELIQDDDVFNSMLINLGMMGITYSFVIGVKKTLYLKETKTLRDWEDVKPEILDGSIHKKGTVRGVMVQVAPYKLKNNKRNCIVVEHKIIGKDKMRSINDRLRNILPTLGNNPLVYAIIKRRINKNPHKMPKTINSALKALKDASYKNKSYKVLYQGVEYIKERAYDSEFAFDVKENKYVDAIEQMFKAAEDMASLGIYQTAPMGLRWVARSNAYLAPQYKRDMCYIDTPFLVGTNGADELLNKYQQISLDHGGIPHWGKINSILDENVNLIPQLYSKLDVWKNVQQQFNPKGTFESAFANRLGLTPTIQTEELI
jgi:hypothetical protein